MSAGLDVPYLAYLDAAGQDLTPLGDFEIGIKWINEPLAFYSLQTYIRSGRNIKDFLSIFKGARSYALWANDDPMPALTFLKEKIMRGFSKIVKTKPKLKSVN